MTIFAFNLPLPVSSWNESSQTSAHFRVKIPRRVYNLETSKSHTYVVSSWVALSHNASTADEALKARALVAYRAQVPINDMGMTNWVAFEKVTITGKTWATTRKRRVGEQR